ncbi:MAG: HEAT repeat domain-containing protein [Planctomycetota bacterium]|nr:HEAT repeat domain-containing protein [Planctomycetota bacterium]
MLTHIASLLVTFAPPPVTPTPVIVPSGFKIEIFAREPLVADPVAIDIDSQGRIFVAESERQERGIEDNRSSAFWLIEDLTAQTVEDRLAYYEKYKDKRKGGMGYYSAYADRIRMIEDSNGDGQGDRVLNFSRDFQEPLDGTGAGVLVDGDDIFYTCIPNLWRLRDANADGIADTTDSMFGGFGVRTALRGHDMHGLTIGIDGRIYWSIGDRGYHVKTREGEVLSDPKSGAVFRCRPDGTQLELFATGLRNPQELAFNEYGDLFTGDNNSDGGDRARFVYVMPRSETGWDMNYQTLEGVNQRGPWNQEGIWHVRTGPDTNYPAWSLPPLAHIGSGPSGLAYTPGTGMPKEWDRRFYLCDFLGSETHSSVIAIQVEMDGAGYKVESSKPFATNVLATDVTFGPDGRVFVSAWGGGWFSTNKGTIYAISDPKIRDALESVKTCAILKEGFSTRSVSELIPMMGHPDVRVRRGAQFALASMGSLSTLQLLALAQAGEADGSDDAAETNDRLRTLAQIHALWALGMQASGIRCAAVTQPDPLAPIVSMLDAEDAEVRTQTARVLGDAGYMAAASKLIEHIVDENSRVRAACAIACAQLATKSKSAMADAIPALAAALFENETKDAFLRHALVVGLAGCADSAKLQELSADQFASVRLGVLLAMRIQKDPAIARFLFDPDFRIATEAARAIWDIPIPSGFAALAAASGRLGALSSESKKDVPNVALIFKRELWKNETAASSNALESTKAFDRKADETGEANEAVGFSDHGNNYLQRLSGVVTAPEDGAYQFYLTSDDHSILMIQEVGAPKSTQVIARVDGYSDPTGWESDPSQISAPIQLRAGGKYVLEARHAQGGGGNHLAIGWKLPSGLFERPIGQEEVDPNISAFTRRTIAANLALGSLNADSEGAAAIAAIAANPILPRAIRMEAISALAEYQSPGRRDRVHGRVDMVVPAARNALAFRRVLKMNLPMLAKDSDGDLRASALKLATDSGIALDQRANLDAVLDPTRPSVERIACLGQLASAKHEALGQALDASLVSSDANLRISARQYLVAVDPARSLKEAKQAIATGSEPEQQAAVQLLGHLTRTSETAISQSANEELNAMLDQLNKDSVAAELRLDLIDAALATGDANSAKVAALMSPKQGTSLTDLLSPNVLTGGDAARGREVLMYQSSAACLRCHAIAGIGGHAGPALDGVGSRLDRYALLQSLLEPQAIMTAGYGSISAMPPMGPLLTPREIRDLVAYLDSLKSSPN